MTSAYGKGVKIDFDIPEDMDAPVFVFLNYEDFYQNHRAMISSVSRKQLENDNASELESSCKGALTNEQMGKTTTPSGQPLDPKQIASPCGFMAKNFPLDVYRNLTTTSGKVIPIQTTGLVMEELREQFVKSDTPYPQWVNVEDDKFINWMKASSTSNFYKQWGRVDENLPKGKYTLTLDNLSNPKDTFEGKKNVVLSTASTFGGKKFVPAIFCIGLGIVMLIVGAALLYLWINPVKAHKEQPLLIDDGY